MGVIRDFDSVAGAIAPSRVFVRATARGPPPKKNVFDPLTQQLDRARDVQKAVDQNADKTRAAVDSQERGDGSP